MQAMVLRASGPVETHPLAPEERPLPEPGPGELRVHVHVCAVCRTDLHVVEGELEATAGRPKLPLVPGHQVVGTVDARGPDLDAGAPGPGARVGIAWLRSTCGRCEPCREGATNLCADARFTGFHADGGYAGHALVPARYAYPIPERFADREAAPLLCAGIIGYRALLRSRVQPGQRLGLYGFGASAHIVIQLARHRGIEVHVCSLREEHRALARELGAAWVGEAAEAPPASLHGAILFAPAGELVPPALRALRPGGTLACAGIHMTPIPAVDYDRELFRERTLTSVTANTRADGLAFLREAAEVPIRPHTETFPLGEANEALVRLKQGRVSGSAVLVMG
jgi:alcohol dehydrogenase, propanol-preferring